MIYHLSIDAQRPQHVASVIAELWGGEALPFPPVYPGSWVAIAGDDRGTMIEVYPAGVELAPGNGDADAVGTMNAAAPRRTPTHVAIATAMSCDRVMAIAAREGWTAETDVPRFAAARGLRNALDPFMGCEIFYPGSVRAGR